MEAIKQIDFSEEYLREVESTFMLKNEYGAVWYRFQGLNDTECLISGIWIMPEFREQGMASKLADMVTQRAKERGCKFLVAKVKPGQPGGEISLISQLKYGFKLSPDIVDGNIVLFKEISL